MIVESPFPLDYPGHIVVPDELTFPQVMALDTALFKARGEATIDACRIALPAINSIVEWHIDNIPAKPTPENIFMAKDPRDNKRVAMSDARLFYIWALAQVVALYNAVREVPKVSSSAPTGSPTNQTPETKMENDSTQSPQS